jgi:hypothetical protein
LRAQPLQPPREKPAAAESPSPAKTPVAREVLPETYYLRDEGRLVPVPNMTYADFARLLELDLNVNGAASTPPAFTVQELLIQGTASRSRADLTVQVTVRLQRKGWIRIPLRFNEAVMFEPPQYDGDGELFVGCEKDTGEYVCWIQASPDKLHRLSMKFAAPVSEVGNELRLKLPVPRATSSELDLRVNVPHASATVNSGLKEENERGEETQFLVAGLAPDFQIAWSKGDPAPLESRPVLLANIQSRVRIDDVRSIKGTVDVTVSSPRGEFDTFHIRLPAGIQLASASSQDGDYGLTQVVSDEAAPDTVYQVKLNRPTTGEVNVQLATEYTPTGNGRSPEFEVAGIAVEEAARHSQTIDVINKLGLSVTWKPGPQVQRTLVPESLKDQPVARFESFRRSCSLRIQVSAEQAEIQVEPLYVLHVEASRIRLNATLNYKLRGTDTDTVDVNFSKWRIDEVLPAGLVDSEVLDRSETQPLSIPLNTMAIPDNREFAIQIEATLELASTDGPILIALPRPIAKSLSPAMVAVLPADNVQLTVAEGELQGLERESFPPQLELPARQQSPLFYRERSDAVSVVFAADVKPRERSVSVGGVCRLKIGRQSLLVQEYLDYRIAYEPLRHLELVVAREVLETGRLKILNDQQALPFLEVGNAAQTNGEQDVPDSTPPESSDAILQVDLLSGRIFACQVLVEYELPLPNVTPGGQTLMQVPLVRPLDSAGTQTTNCRLEIDAGEELLVQVQGDDWTFEQQSTSSRSGQDLVARSFLDSATLLLTRPAQRRPTSTVVRQAWLQTCLGPEERRERAVFRIATNEPQISLVVPDGARVDGVALDGRRVANDNDQSAEVIVGLAEEPVMREHTVELWYSLAIRRLAFGRLTLQTPTVKGSVWTAPFYWHLVTPAQQHVAFLPAEMTPEMTWKWRGLWLGRWPRLDQGDLESWAGASRQESLPETVNHYLFSSLGQSPTLRLTVASRATILLLVSGGTLLIGLLLLYIRPLRHPAVLFLVGLALATVSFLHPDLSVAATQMSLFGLVLVLGACLLKWLMDWRQARRTVIRGATIASPDSQTVRAVVHLGESGSRSLPTTAAAASAVAAGEPRP